MARRHGAGSGAGSALAWHVVQRRAAPARRMVQGGQRARMARRSEADSALAWRVFGAASAGHGAWFRAGSAGTAWFRGGHRTGMARRSGAGTAPAWRVFWAGSAGTAHGSGAATAPAWRVVQKRAPHRHGASFRGGHRAGMAHDSEAGTAPAWRTVLRRPPRRHGARFWSGQRAWRDAWFWGCGPQPQIDWGGGPQPQTRPAGATRSGRAEAAT